MTTIRYFIPEDGDTEMYPNVFLAPKPRHGGATLTLAEIKNSFPLPGSYHFRFKSPLVPGADRDKSTVAVWMDCADDRQPIPTWRNAVVAKVTRIGIEDDDDDDDDDDDFVRPGHAAPPKAAPTPRPATMAPPPQPAPVPAPSFDIFDGPSPPPSAQPRSAPPSGGAPNFLDAPAAGPTSLLDMDAPTNHHTPSSAANDFLGMTSTPSPAAGAYGGYPQQHQQQQHQNFQQQQTPQGFNPYPQNSHQGAFGGLGTPWK